MHARRNRHVDEQLTHLRQSYKLMMSLRISPANQRLVIVGGGV